MVTKAEAERADKLAQLHRDWRDPKKNHPERVEVLTKTWEARGDRPGGSLKLDYVGHANLRDILCSVDPLWSWEPLGRELTGAPVVDKDSKGWSRGLWISLTIHGVTKPGYGTCAPGKADAVKELIGDALRNAAQSFGIAIALWVKSDLADIGDWERLAQLEAEEAAQGDEAPPVAPPEAPAAAAPENGAQPPQAAEQPQPQANGNGQEAVKEPLTADADPAQLSGDELRHQVGKRLGAMRGQTAVAFAAEKKTQGWPGDMTTADDDTLRAVLTWLQNSPTERVVSGS